MDQKGGALFSLLVSRLPPQKREGILQRMAKDAQANIPPPKDALFVRMPSSLLTVDGWMHHIHYSWIAETLKEFPTQIQSLFISLFPSSTLKTLAHFLKLPLPKKTPSRIGKVFLLSHLKEKILPKNLVSEELLPLKPIHFLLSFSKKELTELIDLLGVYDVVAEFPKILDNALLQKIHQALLAPQQDFLKKCLKKPIKWHPIPLSLEKLISNRQTFLLTLHHRGLIRLSFAIAEESQSFIWHFCHLLDTGRTKVIEAQMRKLPAKKLVPIFQEQVFEAAKEIKQA